MFFHSGGALSPAGQLDTELHVTDIEGCTGCFPVTRQLSLIPHHPLTHMAKRRRTVPSPAGSPEGSLGRGGESSSHVKWMRVHRVSKQERDREREDKWHSSRSRKLHYMQRNRFVIVQHQGKSPLMVIAFILMKQKGLWVYICKEITCFIICLEVVSHTRGP